MLGRVLVTWTLVISFATVFGAKLPDSSIISSLATLPQCGQLCIFNTLSATSLCSSTDFACVCASPALNAEIESCVFSTCPPRDGLKTAKIAKDICGVPPKSRGYVVWLVSVLNIGIATIFYLLRLLCRVVLRQRLDWGDITLGLAVILTFPIIYFCFRLAEFGLGQDSWNLPPDNITIILYYYWWAEIFYQAGLPLVRISILFFYLRIFPQDRIRWACYVLIVLNVANLIAFVIASILQCIPIYGAWTFWDGSFHGRCTNLHLQSWVHAGINILFDLLVVILPLPPLARLTASKGRKIQIMVMFSLGFTVTIVSVLRLRTLVVFANTINVTYDYVDPGWYSVIELSVGIVCACLPSIRALLGVYAPNLFVLTKNASTGSTTPNNASLPARAKPIDGTCYTCDDTQRFLGTTQSFDWQTDHPPAHNNDSIEMIDTFETSKSQV